MVGNCGGNAERKRRCSADFILTTLIVNLIVNKCQFMDSFVFAQKNAVHCIGGQNKKNIYYNNTASGKDKKTTADGQSYEGIRLKEGACSAV